MQSGRTPFKKARAERGGHFQTEGAQAVSIIAKIAQAARDPARDLCSAHLRETRELCVVGDGHDAGHQWNADAEACAVVTCLHRQRRLIRRRDLLRQHLPRRSSAQSAVQLFAEGRCSLRSKF